LRLEKAFRLVLSLPLTVTATPKRPKLCKSRSRRKASRRGFFAPARVLVCSPAWARSCAALSTTGVVSSCKRLLETKIQPESPEFGPGHCLPITCGVSMHSPMEDQDCESELPVPGRAAPLFLGVSDGDVGDAPARVRLALWKCLWALDKVGAELVDRDFDLMHYWTARDFLPSGDFLPNGARSGLTKAAKASSEKARLQRMRRAVRAICAFGRWRVPESCSNLGCSSMSVCSLTQLVKRSASLVLTTSPQIVRNGVEKGPQNFRLRRESSPPKTPFT
jgi:hypothetical protein